MMALGCYVLSMTKVGSSCIRLSRFFRNSDLWKIKWAAMVRSNALQNSYNTGCVFGNLRWLTGKSSSPLLR